MESRVVVIRRSSAVLVVLVAIFVAAFGRSDIAEAAEVVTPTWESLYDWPDGHGYSGWVDETSSPDPGAYGLARGLGARAGMWTWLLATSSTAPVERLGGMRRRARRESPVSNLTSPTRTSSSLTIVWTCAWCLSRRSETQAERALHRLR